MAFQLTPGKLGFKLGDVLVGLQDGSTDVPEALKTTGGRAHFLQYLWNPDTLAYEVATTRGDATTDFALQLDVDASVMYVGTAAPGSALSGAVWRIKRITTIGADLAIEWADGDTNFNNVWDNRTGLTYT